MTSLRQDLRLACRALWHRPGFSAAVALTLTLGIGANSVIFSYVDALLLRPLPYRDADRLVRIQAVHGETAGKLSMLEIRYLNQESRLFEGVAGFRMSQYTVTGGGPPEAIAASMNSYNLFEVLGVRPVVGSTWPASDDGTRQFAVVISDRLWRTRYGSDPAIVGRTITLDSYGYTVLGVLPPGFDFPLSSDIYRRPPAQDYEDGRIRSAATVARLKPGVSLAQAAQELDGLARRLEETQPASNAGVRYRLTPLRDYWLGETRSFLVLLAAAVAIVLLVACVNVAGLVLARALERERALAVRVALGATRAVLLRGVLLEVLLLALIGGVGGLALSVWGAAALDTLVRIDRPDWMAVSLDWRVLTFTMVVAALAGMLAGLYPAVQASSIAPGEAVREDGRTASGGRRRRRTRERLVAVQIALAVVLMVGAGLMLRSLDRLRSVALGFRPERVLAVRIDPPWSRFGRVEQTAPFYRRMLEEIRTLPGVEAVAMVDPVPLAGRDPGENAHKHVPLVEGRAPDDREIPFVNLQLVSPEYFGTMGIELRRGRVFQTSDDLDGVPVAIVSERTARAFWPGEDPIGRRVKLGELNGNYRITVDSAPPEPEWMTVVGVVADVREERVTDPGGHALYLSNLQVFTPETHVVVRSRTDPLALVDPVRKAIWKVDPDQAVYDIRTLEDRIGETIWQWRLSGTLLTAFGVVALALAAVGIYGVIALAVSQRRAEFGIRLALGADGPRIILLVLTEAARLAGVSLAVGLAVALALARVLSGMFYGVRPADPIILASVTLILGVVALLSAYLPGRRAAKVDPGVALRSSG
jgi:putative ABC transport system permease protein